MLIQFSVENYGPIAEQATLSMVPVRAFKDHPHCLFPTHTIKTPELLRTALIYGANASGKSTLIKAMGFVQDLVLNSSDENIDAPVAAVPFLLDPETAKSPCGFEVVLIDANATRYQYGFTVLANRIEKEWLYGWPKGSARTLFYREWNTSSGGYTWSPQKLNKNIEGFNHAWLDNALPNQLLLSIAAQKPRRSVLHDVYEWFQDKLVVIGQGKSFDRELSAKLCNTPATKEWVLDWMSRADLTVANIEIRADIEFEMSEFSTMKRMLREKTQSVPSLYRQRLQDEVIIKIPFDMESDGTKKWFEWAGSWKRFLDGGNVVLLDEIETHLHHHLTRYLLDTINNPLNNPSGTQLLASTHDVALLDFEHIRRDQVWILEKTVQQSGVLTALAEYRPRKGEPWMEGFLMGRYGGTPKIRRHGPIGRPI